MLPKCPDDKPPGPERDRTDQSLRMEREKADVSVREKLAAIDKTADAVISQARARADAVIARARARTDRESAARPGKSPSPEIIDSERVTEDLALRGERAIADEALRTARAQDVAPFSITRRETDKDLSLERTTSDHAVATRDEFLRIVSHDLRTLLQAMVSSAEVIAMRMSRETDANEVLRSAMRIQRSGAQMNRLIGDLIDCVSIEAGMLAITREIGDPSHLATEAVDAFQAHASASGVTLMADIPPPSSLAAFDAARILQVLCNLVSNAIKFTAAGGTVVVRVARVRNDIRFAVSDTGAGIPSDSLEAVFERFLQVQKRDARGVGLGLYISKCIVQGHGGRIWAESRIGEGSTFCFTVPIHVAA